MNLPWCDGTGMGLAELERSRPVLVQETLIHGDLALALQTKPELELSAEALDAFFAGYDTAALDEETRDWFVRLYDFF